MFDDTWGERRLLRGGNFIGNLQGEVSDSDTIPLAGSSDAEDDDLLLKRIREYTIEGVDLSSPVASFIDKVDTSSQSVQDAVYPLCTGRTAMLVRGPLPSSERRTIYVLSAAPRR